MQRFIISPDAMRRVVWTILGSFMILWDILTIPMTLYEESDIVATASVITMIYWILDSFFVFLVGVQEIPPHTPHPLPQRQQKSPAREQTIRKHLLFYDFL